MINTHSFHIPVMGIAFTIDTPLKVSQYGIDSAVSLCDDIILEKLRRMYSDRYNMPYLPITEKIEDFRAKRITSYLNLINSLAERKFEEFKNASLETSREIKAYFDMLPDTSSLKHEFKKLTSKYFNLDELKTWLKKHLYMGSIDVNIMTKVDKDNYIKEEKLPIEYNDAHAALRGYAMSDLSSSLIFSAGMNPRLYSYLGEFPDFYPDTDGLIKKKIALKVSDFRSAFIQGKFLAKKGIWVSEYRIESGLNCGGHAFATDGFLLGPILAEFRENRKYLIDSIHELLINALESKGLPTPTHPMPIKITAQGGVGTSVEHQFLIDHYKIDSVGWGSPFLLVPEATTVDESTLQKLMDAKEDDLYLSKISPLGVPFNNLKDNSKDLEKLSLADKGRPGSSCPKKFLSLNNEFTEKPICTASRQYQNLKLKALKKEHLSEEAYQIKRDAIIEKSCLCAGLGTSALIVNNLDTRTEGTGVSVCPGPNMAYFSKLMSLEEITDHMYGRINVIMRSDRPNMFIKELMLYVEYLKNKVDELGANYSRKELKYVSTFIQNIKNGIDYYKVLFLNMENLSQTARRIILGQLAVQHQVVEILDADIKTLATPMKV